MSLLSLVTWLSGGFWTGFCAGAGCVAVCGAVLLPVVLSHRASVLRNVHVLAWFCFGRLCVYILFGIVLGWAGSVLQEHAWFAWVLPFAYLAAALALLRYLSRAPKPASCSSVCHAVPSHLPFVLGLITGANVCPPFVVAMAAALGSGSVAHGLAYFIAFFLGTTIYLVPLPLAGYLARWHAWQRLGRLAGTVVGFVYVYLALSALHAQLHPAQPAVCPVAPGAAEPAPADLRLVFPNATHVTPSPHAPHVCVALSNNQPIGCMVDSRLLNISVPGYAGPTPVLFALDLHGVVTNIHILPNRETPRFLLRVTNSAWWQQFTGLTLDGLLAALDQPDAVAGATMSSEALRAQLRAAALAAQPHFSATLACPAPPAVHAVRNIFSFSAAVAWLPVAVLCVCAVLAATLPRWQKPAVRWIIWIAAIALLGCYRANYFSIAQIGLLIRGTAPPLEHFAWYVLFAFALLAPLVWGRVYCHFLCPFGVLSDALHRLTPWSLTLPHALTKWLRYVKFVLLIGALVWLVVAPAPPAERLEPFHAIFIHPQPRAYVIFGVSVLLVSLFVKRLWCTLFCLDGALFELIARFRSSKKP